MTTPAVTGDVCALAPTRMFLGGDWREGSSTFAVEDPSTGERIAGVADATPADAVAALDAASDAQDAWAATPSRQRSDLLARAFARVNEEADRFVAVMRLEAGKTEAEARAELAYGTDFLRWYAEEAVRGDGDYRSSPSGDKRILTSARPVGPVLLITPWNFPLAMVTRKVAPALAAGCTAVLKPAPQTPLTALLFAEILEGCGLPPGVLSVLPASDGAGLVAPLFADRRLRKVSFTGSTAVGRILAAQAAPNLLRTSMELGGAAPFVVFDDADVERAVDAAVVAKLRNAGQSCTAANRFLVQEGVAAAFTDALVDRLAQQRVGPASAPDTDVGPLIDRAARDRVARRVTRARAGGAQILVAGDAPDAPGYFFAPTLVSGLPDGHDLVANEVFGPVASIATFADEDEAVRRCTATESGLVAYLHTTDLDRALRVSDRLDVGMVGLNRGVVSEASAPFGGVGQSGLGREGGHEGLREYQELRYLAVAV